ncbi:hypothetical protein SLS62_002365 [Diatrype stigma]|uniref:Uncharacterized protein n=1 Tax=Diatrype stigma TaxID=117547 RepID=A0AAN9UZ28_9PEZI
MKPVAPVMRTSKDGMMAVTNVVYVLSHHYLHFFTLGGAWTQPTAYWKLGAALEARKFRVHVPGLATDNGSRPHNSTFDTDVQAVRQVVKSPAGGDGGIVSTSAIAGLARRDRQLRNLRGGTIRKVVQGVNLPGRGGPVTFKEDGTWFHSHSNQARLLYHNLEPEEKK